MLVVLTKHARDAMRRRGVTFNQVHEVATRPQITRDSSRDGMPTRLFTRGDLSIVVMPTEDTLVVVTVLLNTPRMWNDQDAKHRRK